jgi:hypothetical protein
MDAFVLFAVMISQNQNEHGWLFNHIFITNRFTMTANTEAIRPQVSLDVMQGSIKK